MQDYEYEAHAKDIKLENITSSQNNAQILARLRDGNDDPCTYFAIVTEVEDDDGDFLVREGDDLGWLGYFVGRNQRLLTLFIDNFPENINLDEFFEGLGHNRSIEDLNISKDLGESFQSLIPFMKNNDRLRHLYFYYFDIRLQNARNISILLSQQSSITRLHFEDVGFDDEGLVQIAAALRSQPQIEELYLYFRSNGLGRNGYVALGNALEGCLNLRELDLVGSDNNGGNESISDEGLNALVEGLKNCHNLTSLILDGSLIMAEEATRSLSTLFQSDNCRLERLDLAHMNICDDEMAVLATGLSSLPSLKTLSLRDYSIGGQGVQDLVEGLANCNLEELSLSNNTLVYSISGLRKLGTLVQRSTNMHSLSVCACSVTNEVLQSFVEGMANCCNLTELSLAYNRLITANGLASFSSLFRSDHCSLSVLSLDGINIGDDEAEVLANGLIGNKSLTTLRVDKSSITARGWSAFSRLLCDTSSVNNTYLSNHTLVHIGESDMRDTPQHIVKYLKLNETDNQAAVICKILHSHPDIDVTPLFQFNLMCLPLVVAWFEKAKSCLCNVNESTESFQSRELSAVYKFVRDMPQLAANGYRSQKEKDVQLQSKSKKRTIDQTL